MNMEQRACQRIPADIPIRYLLWNPLIWKMQYEGIIKNISEKGLFIDTKTRSFPRDSLLELYIPVKGKDLYIQAKFSNIAWRRMLSDDTCDAIGIELSNPPREYLEFVESLKADLSS
jgi:hypothetical protein